MTLAACAADRIQTVIISPTRAPNGTWAFDDADKGLVEEPFIGAMNTLLDVLAGNFMHDDPFDGCMLVAANSPFAGYQVELWQLSQDVRPSTEGRWYRWIIHNEQGAVTGTTFRELYLDVWLCPVVELYFGNYPAYLYLKMHEGNAPA